MITEKNKNFLAKFGSSDHIDKLMNDENRYVLATIARHPLYKKMKAEGKL